MNVANASTPAKPTLDKLAERADLAEKQKEEAKRLQLAQQAARKKELFEAYKRNMLSTRDRDEIKRLFPRPDEREIDWKQRKLEMQKRMQKRMDAVRPPLE
jgi:hypothetical protein